MNVEADTVFDVGKSCCNGFLLYLGMDVAVESPDLQNLGYSLINVVYPHCYLCSATSADCLKFLADVIKSPARQLALHGLGTAWLLTDAKYSIIIFFVKPATSDILSLLTPSPTTESDSFPTTGFALSHSCPSKPPTLASPPHTIAMTLRGGRHKLWYRISVSLASVASRAVKRGVKMHVRA